MMLLVLVAIGGTTEVSAQSWLDQLGKKVKEKAKDKVEQKILEKTDQAIDKAFEKTEDAVKGNGGNQTGVPQEAAPQQPIQQAPQQAPVVQETPAEPVQAAPQPQSLETTYAKSDFVPGDEIIFEDLVDNEQLGEFPSMWDLKKGSAEVAEVNGKKAITSDGSVTTIAPLMKDMTNYLPEKFTLEMDILMAPRGQGDSYYKLHFYNAEKKRIMTIEIDSRVNYVVDWDYISTSGDRIEGNFSTKDLVQTNGWHHLAISFNKRAFKIYIDGTRIANIPNMSQPANFAFDLFPMNGAKTNYVTNIRLAQGAVPLYDRMMSDGKFITYGITFDVGKSTIKPESMGEINRIVQLMTENPDLKFSVEGHTDSTGNATSNQTLSEQRSQAIVAKLVELGIAQDRLTAVGKGQNNPIADNNTDEGRAKNRRVEFVKQ
ncbi:OmpA family protein [Fibrobacter sp.]|uniref:OmpA family protein n=1 Tax=Fibrobacter sp. TaxID=35828 RepID=UPI003890B296